MDYGSCFNFDKALGVCQAMWEELYIYSFL